MVGKVEVLYTLYSVKEVQDKYDVFVICRAINKDASKMLAKGLQGQKRGMKIVQPGQTIVEHLC